jgi:hypothetical protein
MKLMVTLQLMFKQELTFLCGQAIIATRNSDNGLFPLIPKPCSDISVISYTKGFRKRNFVQLFV